MLHLNLRLCRWLRPSRSIVNNFSFSGLWGLRTLFGNSHIKLNKSFTNILMLYELQIFLSSLFHSLMTDWKKVFRKLIGINFTKANHFLQLCQFCDSCKPNSLKSNSLEVKWMAPDRAKLMLRYIRNVRVFDRKKHCGFVQIWRHRSQDEMWSSGRFVNYK